MMYIGEIMDGEPNGQGTYNILLLMGDHMLVNTRMGKDMVKLHHFCPKGEKMNGNERMEELGTEKDATKWET